MRKYYLSAFGMAFAALVFVAPVNAQDISLIGCETACCDNGGCDGLDGCDGCDGSACDSSGCCDGIISGCDSCDGICGGGCGCNSGGIYTEVELLLLKYSRADGVRVGADDGDQVFGEYYAAPRISVGWVSANGLGARIRYFEFDQGLSTENGGLENVGVDTFTLDFEVFEKICLNKNWTIELSGGLRYNEFEERMVDTIAPFPGIFVPGTGIVPGNQVVNELRVNRFNGWGGVVGLQANRRVGRYGSVYGRMRGSILVDDKYVANSFGFGGPPLFADDENLTDATLGMTEIAVGYEYNRFLGNGSLLFARCGFEWQQWHNFSSSFAGPLDTDDAFFSLGESIFTGPSDVGFYGVTFSIGIEM